MSPNESRAGRAASGTHISDGGAELPSTFDPADIYFVVSATLHPGTIWREAGIVHLGSTNDLIAGFPGDGPSWYSLALVAPEGRILYNKSSSTGEANGRWFEWRADATWSRESKYPSTPEANDRRVETPGCDDTRFGGILPRPEGGYLYWCFNGIFEADGRQIADREFVKNAAPLALTYGNLMLGRVGVKRLFADLNTLSTREIEGFSDVSETLIASRAVPDGFLVATSAGPLRAGENDAWHIGFDATATRVGTYPLLSDSDSVLGTLALDANGALYSRTEEEVTQRTLDGTSEVVYRLTTDAPFVAEAEGYIAGMFTGP